MDFHSFFQLFLEALRGNQFRLGSVSGNRNLTSCLPTDILPYLVVFLMEFRPCDLALVLGTRMGMVLTDFVPKGTMTSRLCLPWRRSASSPCGINYPIYAKILKERKQKYAFEIVELAKEISEKE